MQTLFLIEKNKHLPPINKGGNDKHIHTNYRPVSILNTISKIIELAIFDQPTNIPTNFYQFCINLSQNVRHTTRTYKIR